MFSPGLTTIGAVAGKDFPLSDRPMVPASLSIIGISWVMFTPGTGT
jgi:hypothetical protein